MGQPISAAAENSTDRWISAQQVALGATLLTVHGSTSSHEDAVFGNRLWQDARAPSGSELDRYLTALEALPPSTLEALCALPKSALVYWEDHLPCWKMALARQSWETVRGKARSPIAGAKLLADRITHGNLKPAQLLRLARHELGRNWPSSPRVSDALVKLSSQMKKSNERIEAIAEFNNIGNNLSRWAMVENSLLQLSFYWPMLIMQLGRRSKYCTLPIQVNVTLGSDSSLKFIHTSDRIDSKSWYAPATAATRAAKDLWNHKHTSWDFRFQKSVRDASVTIDLTAAEEIIEPYQLSGISLDGRSLEAYLGLIILSHLTQSAMSHTCATGLIGARLGNGRGQYQQHKGADYWIDPPELKYIDDKINCAADAFFFDQIIIPTGVGRRESRKHLKVSNGAKFSDYATHALGQAWRRHRYIRCPDFSHSFKRFKHMQPDASEAAAIQGILDLLAVNDSPVLELEPTLSPLLVGDALYRIQEQARKDPDPSLGGWAENEKLGSFAFVRVVPNELNERFWQVIWDILGGDHQEFSEFCFAVFPKTVPAEILAGLFNSRPTPAKPIRPPDILVLIGHQLLSEASSIPTGPFSRLQLCQLLEMLRDRLKPSLNPAIRNQVRNTRIILAYEERRVPPEVPSKVIIEDVLLRKLRRLSIFRHGFTFQMAQKMLKCSYDECESTLQEAIGFDLEGKPLIAYAESAGEYVLLWKTSMADEADALPDLHFDAANSIVGFLDRTDDAARFEFRTGLTPAWLHEAQWHLEEAWRNRGDRIHKSGPARERLGRAGEDFGWSRVRWAAQFSKEDAFDIWLAVRDHLDSLPKGQFVHPLELVWAAKLAYKLENDPSRKDLEELARFRISTLAGALKACDVFGRSLEGDACRFVVLTTRSSMTMADDPSDEGLASASWHIEKARKLISAACEIADPQWFEFIGDGEDDNAAATNVYREGFWNDRIRGAAGMRVECLVKYLGSCHMASVKPAEAVMSRLSSGVSAGAFKRVREAQKNEKSGLWKRHCAQERWRIGRNILLSTFQRFEQ